MVGGTRDAVNVSTALAGFELQGGAPAFAWEARVVADDASLGDAFERVVVDEVGSEE